MILKIHLGSLKIHKQITEIDATIKKGDLLCQKEKKRKIGRVEGTLTKSIDWYNYCLTSFKRQSELSINCLT